MSARRSKDCNTKNTKKSEMGVEAFVFGPFTVLEEARCPASFSAGALLRDAFLRVLRVLHGSIFSDLEVLNGGVTA
jgi:hypothetical protein